MLLGLLPKLFRPRRPKVAKELFEFYCSGGCQGYFRTKLRTNIDGDYIIECPGCQHVHHRQIRKGQITGDRHGTTEEKGAERIVVPKSAYSKEPVLDWGESYDDKQNAKRVGGKTKRWLLWERFSGRGEGDVARQRDVVKQVKKARKKKAGK